MKDKGIMGADDPASKDMREEVLVVSDTLHDEEEVALIVDECLDVLG